MFLSKLISVCSVFSFDKSLTMIWFLFMPKIMPSSNRLIIIQCEDKLSDSSLPLEGELSVTRSSLAHHIEFLPPSLLI